MIDKLHTFSLGEIDEPEEVDTTPYRKAKRNGNYDSRGRKMPMIKRSISFDVVMTTKEFEALKINIINQIEKTYKRRENV